MSTVRLSLFTAVIFTFAAATLPAFAAAASALPTPDPDNGGIKLPNGFRAVVVAELDEHGGPRFLAVAPNGDIYARMRRNGIFALRDTNGDGRADVREHFGSGSGSGIAVRGDYLYFSTDSSVQRYRLTPGQRAITSFNRNWTDRMGVGGEGYLASPAVVASSALRGYMGPPSELGLAWEPELFGV